MAKKPTVWTMATGLKRAKKNAERTYSRAQMWDIFTAGLEWGFTSDPNGELANRRDYENMKGVTGFFEQMMHVHIDGEGEEPQAYLVPPGSKHWNDI
jgi:hypothetical protein